MKKKKIILGIQILRAIFSFHILVFHCINKKNYQSKIIKGIINDVSIDLGIFFIISFYYSYEIFTSKNIIKIKERLFRLLIKKRYSVYLGLIGIFFYIFLHSYYFDLLFPPKILLFFTIRPIPRSYIYLLLGFFLFKFNLVFLFKKYIKFYISIILIVLYYFFINIYGKKEIFHIFKVVLCIYVFMAFLILPLNKNENIILIITSYTGGIYYLHNTMRKIIEFLFNMKSQTLLICIINYLLCYIICLIGSKIFRNYYIRYLFK